MLKIGLWALAQRRVKGRRALCLRLPAAGAPTPWTPPPMPRPTPLALDRSPNVICLEKYRQLKALGRIYIRRFVMLV